MMWMHDKATRIADYAIPYGIFPDIMKYNKGICITGNAIEFPGYDVSI